MPKARPIDLSRLNISEYLFNKKARATTTFVYSPTEQFFLVGEQKIQPKLFEALFPLHITNTNPKGTGKDGRTNFYQ